MKGNGEYKDLKNTDGRVKRSIISLTSVSGKHVRENGGQAIFEKLMTENLPELNKGIIIQI